MDLANNNAGYECSKNSLDCEACCFDKALSGELTALVGEGANDQYVLPDPDFVGPPAPGIRSRQWYCITKHVYGPFRWAL